MPARGVADAQLEIPHRLTPPCHVGDGAGPVAEAVAERIGALDQVAATGVESLRFGVAEEALGGFVECDDAAFAIRGERSVVRAGNDVDDVQGFAEVVDRREAASPLLFKVGRREGTRGGRR